MSRSVLVEILEGGALRGHALTASGTAIGTGAAVKAAGANVKPEHARVTHVGDAWRIEPVEDAELVVNGIAKRKAQALVTGDRLSIGATRFIFYVMNNDGLPSQQNGFDRARAWIQRALQNAADTDRGFLENLADLEGAIAQSERVAVIQSAIVLMNEREWQKAAAELDKLLAVTPDHANAVFHRAICFARLGRIDHALAEARRARQLSDDEELTNEIDEFLQTIPFHMVQAAIKRLNADDYVTARLMLESANKTYPNDAYVQSHLAVCYAHDGHHAEAKSLIDSALRNAKDDDALESVELLRAQVERTASSSSVKYAIAMLDTNPSRALGILQDLPPSVRASDDIRFFILVARAKASPYGYVGQRHAIRAELMQLANSTDDPDIRSNAIRLAGQLV